MALDIDGITCPLCGKAAVATFDADLPDVTSFGVVGGLQWGCPSCGRGGTLEYTAYYVHAVLFDDSGDKAGEVDRMSWYTDQAVTVDAGHAEAFLALLRTLSEEEREYPDSLHRDGAGRVTAVWRSRNHFASSATGRALEAFLDDLGWEDYFMETFDEDYGRETRGCGCIGFYSFVGFDVDGEEVGL